MNNVKCVSKYTKQLNRRIHHHNAKHLVTEIKHRDPTQCNTSTPIDELKAVVNTVSHNNVTKLLKEIQENSSVGDCFTSELHDAIKIYNFLDTDNQLLHFIKKIQEKYITKCGADKYYLVFYSDIVTSFFS